MLTRAHPKLGLMHPIRNFIPHLFKIRFNIILSPPLRCPKWPHLPVTCSHVQMWSTNITKTTVYYKSNSTLRSVIDATLYYFSYRQEEQVHRRQNRLKCLILLTFILQFQVHYFCWKFWQDQVSVRESNQTYKVKSRHACIWVILRYRLQFKGDRVQEWWLHLLIRI
jgi:hypothetical protein